MTAEEIAAVLVEAGDDYMHDSHAFRLCGPSTAEEPHRELAERCYAAARAVEEMRSELLEARALMAEAAQEVFSYVIQIDYVQHRFFCLACEAQEDSLERLIHTPACLVTRLRVAAGDKPT
jgi:hypothetical protein